MQIFLKGNAVADINSKTTGLYSVIDNSSNLKLSGLTNHHIFTVSKTAKLTLDKFDANISIIEGEEFLAKTK